MADYSYLLRMYARRRKPVLLLGTVLVILGLGSFAMTPPGPPQWKLLIPALYGGSFLAIYFVMRRRPTWHGSLLSVSGLLALVLVLDSIDDVRNSVALIAGEYVQGAPQMMAMAIAAVLCAFFMASLFPLVRTLRSPGRNESA